MYYYLVKRTRKSNEKTTKTAKFECPGDLEKHCRAKPRGEFYLLEINEHCDRVAQNAFLIC